MKKLLYLILLLSLFSCEFDDAGNPHLTGLFWILLIGFIFAVIAGIWQGESNLKKKNQGLKKMGLDPNQIFRVGKYVGGHPDIDKVIELCSIYKKNDSLLICEPNYNLLPATKARIPLTSIKNITIEDSSSIDKKVTLGRVLLIGVFALAWRKNKKDEHAFISIDWNDGKFDHSTLFSFEGKDAMQKANISRNKLIQMAR